MSGYETDTQLPSPETALEAETTTEENAGRENSWAAGNNPEEKSKSNGHEKNSAPNPHFLQKILPKSREGRIVFANGVAQVASMTVAPLAVLVLEKLGAKEVAKISDYLGKILGKHMDRIEPVIGKPWRSSMSENIRKEWINGSKDHKGRFMAEVMVNMGLQGISNVGTTIGTRILFDRLLKTSVGTPSIIFSQVLDTFVAVAGMVALPSLLPDATRKARENVKSYLEEKQQNSNWRMILGRNPKAPRQFALNTVNFAIPDLVGFAAGTYSMLHKAKREKQVTEGQEIER